MPKYRVGDMHIRHGVGDKIRELIPGSVVDLSAEEATAIGKSVELVGPEEAGAGAAGTAAEVIAKIQVADSVDAVKALLGGDTRKTVVAAAEKRIADLTPAG